jgi:hypothetical protein
LLLCAKFVNKPRRRDAVSNRLNALVARLVHMNERFKFLKRSNVTSMQVLKIYVVEALVALYSFLDG